MKILSKIASVFVLCPFLIANAQIGHYGSHTLPKTAKYGGVHTDSETQYTGDPAVQPIAGASIYLFEPGTHGPNTAAYSLIDCSLAGGGTVQGPDANGNCYVVSASDGTFRIDYSLTNYYNQCDSDSSLVYMLAVGGQRTYAPSDPLQPDPSLENALIANIAVSPVDCATLTTESNFLYQRFDYGGSSLHFRYVCQSDHHSRRCFFYKEHDCKYECATDGVPSSE